MVLFVFTVQVVGHFFFVLLFFFAEGVVKQVVVVVASVMLVQVVTKEKVVQCSLEVQTTSKEKVEGKVVSRDGKVGPHGVLLGSGECKAIRPVLLVSLPPVVRDERGSEQIFEAVYVVAAACSAGA